MKTSDRFTLRETLQRFRTQPIRTTLMRTALVVLLGMSVNAWAIPIVIVNPDFETDAAADPDGLNGAVTGWGPGGLGVRLAATFDPAVAGGAIFAGENNYFALQAQSNPMGALGGVSFASGSQNVTTILANTRYTLSVNVAHDARFAFSSNVPTDDTYPANFNNGNPIVLARLVDATTSAGFGQTAGVTLVSDNAAFVASGSVATWTLVYDTGAAPADLGGTLAIQLFVQSNTAGGQQTVLFDNVMLDVSPVPEPGTVALLGIGGLFLAGRFVRGKR
ncbi:MAG: PEP-CTERM sorting domain-containing protein [Verrucomicrobiota bacterium]